MLGSGGLQHLVRDLQRIPARFPLFFLLRRRIGKHRGGRTKGPQQALRLFSNRVCLCSQLLELGENYTPEISEYKEGKIVSFDLTTKQIELELLHASQAPVEPGKFDLVYQNADGSESVEYAVSRGAWVTERWDSLLEPRLII
nr:PREDICTED: coilin-like [Paralichthys olivaceus]